MAQCSVINADMSVEESGKVTVQWRSRSVHESHCKQLILAANTTADLVGYRAHQLVKVVPILSSSEHVPDRLHLWYLYLLATARWLEYRVYNDS